MRATYASHGEQGGVRLLAALVLLSLQLVTQSRSPTRADRDLTAPAASTTSPPERGWWIKGSPCANRPVGVAVMRRETSTADLLPAPLVGTEIDVQPHGMQTEQGTDRAATYDLEDVWLRGVETFADKE